VCCRTEKGATRVPTIARIGPYRFFFYSNEGTEQPHVHVRRERALTKFWLQPVELAAATAYGAAELTKLEKIVRENEEQFLEAWHEHFEG
jgi:hypothetical protein